MGRDDSPGIGDDGIMGCGASGVRRPTPLGLAFCLFEFVPVGGMQRNLVRIAQQCRARGHRIDIYCRVWQGPAQPSNVITLSGSGVSNHQRCKSFASRLRRHLQTRSYDAVIGFNRMPGLDIYFASDYCFAAKAAEKGETSRRAGRALSQAAQAGGRAHREGRTSQSDRGAGLPEAPAQGGSS